MSFLTFLLLILSPILLRERVSTCVVLSYWLGFDHRKWKRNKQTDIQQRPVKPFVKTLHTILHILYNKIAF